MQNQLWRKTTKCCLGCRAKSLIVKFLNILDHVIAKKMLYGVVFPKVLVSCDTHRCYLFSVKKSTFCDIQGLYGIDFLDVIGNIAKMAENRGDLTKNFQRFLKKILKGQPPY